MLRLQLSRKRLQFIVYHFPARNASNQFKGAEGLGHSSQSGEQSGQGMFLCDDLRCDAEFAQCIRRDGADCCDKRGLLNRARAVRSDFHL